MTIDTAFLAALLPVLGSAVGAFAGIVINTRLTTYRIEQLEKKVDKHNGVVERTYNLEERLEVQQEQIRVANHRIADLEQQARQP